MEKFTGFAEVASALILAMGLAMWLEWFTLSVLMRLMPPRRIQDARSQTQPAPAVAESDLPAAKARLTEPSPARAMSASAACTENFSGHAA